MNFRFQRRALLAATALVFAGTVFAAPPTKQSADQQALQDALLDLQAVIRTGLSYNDLVKSNQNITVLVSRMKRRGGKNDDLESTAEAYRHAEGDLKEKIAAQVRFDASPNNFDLIAKNSFDNSLQGDFQWADKRLESYAKSLKSKR